MLHLRKYLQKSVLQGMEIFEQHTILALVYHVHCSQMFYHVNTFQLANKKVSGACYSCVLLRFVSSKNFTCRMIIMFVISFLENFDVKE